MKKKAILSVIGKVKGFVRSVTGVPPIALEACADNMSIINYKIHGNSIQDGTPSPDNPIEVQSVGELVTDETDVHYGKYKIPVTARSKNLFDVDYYMTYNKEQETIRGDTKFSDNFWKNDDGNGFTFKNIAYVGAYNDYPLTCKENTQYTLSFEAEWISTDSRAQTGIAIRYVDNSYKKVAIYFSNAKQKYTITSETNKTVGGIQIYIWQYSGRCKISNIQLEEGVAATDYEPYHEPTTTNIYLDEPLRKVGDYADYIDFKNSIVVRKTHTIALSECSYNPRNALLDNGFVRAGYFEPPSSVQFLGGVGRPGFCNVLPRVTSWYIQTSEGIRFGQGNKMFYIFTKSTYASKAELLNYLGEAKATYILKTPIETSISLPILPTFKGLTTIYEAGTTIQPSNMEAEYYSTLKGE